MKTMTFIYIVAPIIVSVVSYIFKKLIDEWLNHHH